MYTLDKCMDFHLGSSPLNHCHLTQHRIIIFVSYRFDHMTIFHHGIPPTQASTPLSHRHHSFLIVDAMSTSSHHLRRREMTHVAKYKGTPRHPEIQARVLLMENQTPKDPTLSLHYASMSISEACRYKHIKCQFPYRCGIIPNGENTSTSSINQMNDCWVSPLFPRPLSDALSQKQQQTNSYMSVF